MQDDVTVLLAAIESTSAQFPSLTPEKVLPFVKDVHPMALPELDTAYNTLTRSQMLRTDDKEEVLKAKAKETEGLEELGVWQYHRISTLPPHAKLINSVWSYRWKRMTHSLLRKYKARFVLMVDKDDRH